MEEVPCYPECLRPDERFSFLRNLNPHTHSGSPTVPSPGAGLGVTGYRLMPMCTSPAAKGPSAEDLEEPGGALASWASCPVRGTNVGFERGECSACAWPQRRDCHLAWAGGLSGKCCMLWAGGRLEAQWGLARLEHADRGETRTRSDRAFLEAWCSSWASPWGQQGVQQGFRWGDMTSSELQAGLLKVEWGSTHRGAGRGWGVSADTGSS